MHQSWPTCFLETASQQRKKPAEQPMQGSDKPTGRPYLRKYRWPVGVLAISQPWGSGTSSGMIDVAATSAAWVARELTGSAAGAETVRLWWGVREPHTPPSELAWRETSRSDKRAEIAWEDGCRSWNSRRQSTTTTNEQILKLKIQIYCNKTCLGLKLKCSHDICIKASVCVWKGNLDVFFNTKWLENLIHY